MAAQLCDGQYKVLAKSRNKAGYLSLGAPADKGHSTFRLFLCPEALYPCESLQKNKISIGGARGARQAWLSFAKRGFVSQDLQARLRTKQAWRAWRKGNASHIVGRGLVCSHSKTQRFQNKHPLLGHGKYQRHPPTLEPRVFKISILF
jgi:hypothetical protein